MDGNLFAADACLSGPASAVRAARATIVAFMRTLTGKRVGYYARLAE